MERNGTSCPTQGESVLEYFHEKVHLCSLLELKFPETKMQVLEGLFSKDLSVHLLSRDHADADELLNDVVNFERLDASRTLRIRQLTSSSKEQQSPRTPTLMRTTGTRQATIPNPSTGGPVKICFNCGSKSHIASACTKPRIEKGACYQCGSTTHQRSKCPIRTTSAKHEDTSKGGSTSEGDSRVMNVNCERPNSVQGHPRPYEVVCECSFPVDQETSCGITFTATIDTGSPISLLKRELLPFNYDVIKPLVNDCNFSGINGTKLELLGVFETEIRYY